MPLSFSIITCTRNSAGWLDACIASVCKQTHTPVEMIFVDGASTDGTLEKIRAIGRPYTLIENVTGGVGAAMNRGIAAATGDVIAHLHADDYYLHPGVLAKVADELEMTQADWLFGRICRDVGGQLLDEGYLAPSFTYARLLKRNFIPHPATFARRSLFARCGVFRPELRYAMDYDLWLRFARTAVPAQINAPLAAFRVHAGSLSTRCYLAAMEEDFRVRLDHAGANPVSRVLHAARYLVRKHRALRAGSPLS